jgi:hypothetical protein
MWELAREHSVSLQLKMRTVTEQSSCGNWRGNILCQSPAEDEAVSGVAWLGFCSERQQAEPMGNQRGKCPSCERDGLAGGKVFRSVAKQSTMSNPCKVTFMMD